MAGEPERVEPERVGAKFEVVVARTMVTGGYVATRAMRVTDKKCVVGGERMVRESVREGLVLARLHPWVTEVMCEHVGEGMPLRMVCERLRAATLPLGHYRLQWRVVEARHESTLTTPR